MPAGKSLQKTATPSASFAGTMSDIEPATHCCERLVPAGSRLATVQL